MFQEQQINSYLVNYLVILAESYCLNDESKKPTELFLEVLFEDSKYRPLKKVDKNKIIIK